MMMIVMMIVTMLATVVWRRWWWQLYAEFNEIEALSGLSRCSKLEELNLAHQVGDQGSGASKWAGWSNGGIWPHALRS